MNKKIIAMQKVLIANKILFLLLVSIFYNKLYSQSKIIGKYSSLMLHQEHYKYFDFHENGIFEYYSGASLGDDEHAKGHYQIKNDSLILNYDLTELKYESFFKAQKYYNTKDSIEVNLNIYNFNKVPLNNIMVYSFPNYISTESNKRGFAFLKLKKSNQKEKIKLHVDGSFWSQQIIYLDSDANYNLEVFMSKSVIEGFTHPKAIKNEIIKYKIIENNENQLKLQKDNKLIILKKIMP